MAERRPVRQDRLHAVTRPGPWPGRPGHGSRPSPSRSRRAVTCTVLGAAASRSSARSRPCRTPRPSGGRGPRRGSPAPRRGRPRPGRACAARRRTSSTNLRSRRSSLSARRRPRGCRSPSSRRRPRCCRHSSFHARFWSRQYSFCRRHSSFCRSVVSFQASLDATLPCSRIVAGGLGQLLAQRPDGLPDVLLHPAGELLRGGGELLLQLGQLVHAAFQLLAALVGQRVHLLALDDLVDDEAVGLQPGQPRVDRAGGGRVDPEEPVLQQPDHLVAVPRALLQQLQQVQPQPAVAENRAHVVLTSPSGVRRRRDRRRGRGG